LGAPAKSLTTLHVLPFGFDVGAIIEIGRKPLNDASRSQESDFRTLFTILNAVIKYAVELGKLILQQHMIMAGLGNVPRAACTGFNAIERLLRGF
jgi:hypothetical protein